MSQLTLGYWGLRGIVQPIRFLLEYLEVPFEDRKYNDPAVWQAEKAELLKTSPLANIPYLKDGDHYYYESGAIAFHLALKAGREDLLGTNPDEKVRMAQIAGIISDLRTAAGKYIFGKKEDFDKEQVLAAGKAFFTKLEFLVTGHKWAAGENLTLSDFLLYETTEFLKHFNEEAFHKFHHLAKLHHHFSEIPQIKAYVHSERFQARPFYPPHLGTWA